MTISAWIFPGVPACSASLEFSDGRSIDILKSQYLTLQNNGTLYTNTVQNSGCNGFSQQNVELVKKYSKQQFITIPGHIAGMVQLLSSQSNENTFIATVFSLLSNTGFSGVEIDFEDFSKWNQQEYQAYLLFIDNLGMRLHDSGYQLAVVGPAIPDGHYQGYYQFTWSDMRNLHIDQCVVMAYDYMWDYSSGTAVAPISWIRSISQSMINSIGDVSKIVIGLNSYGYTGTLGKYDIQEMPYAQILLQPGFDTAIRDTSSNEMMWTIGNTVYNYSDSTTLDSKLQAVQSIGIENVSIWYLGGNKWFSQTDHILTEEQYAALVNFEKLMWPNGQIER